MYSPAVIERQWVRRFHPVADPQARLFCFPYAGGSASYYFELSSTLAPTTELVAIQYPGRQERRREPFATSITDIADSSFTALRALADRPFALFGHSMGAIVAFEVASRFQAAGAAPCWLFASGRGSPSRGHVENVHLRDDDKIIEELRALGGTDPRWLDDQEMVAAALPAIRSDYRAIETYVYRPGPRLRCPVTAFTGDSDPYATTSEVRDWRDHSDGPFDLRVLPGGHFFLNANWQEVRKTISSSLKAVTERK
jgi:pyochelin biosynthesis protein PchC